MPNCIVFGCDSSNQTKHSRTDDFDRPIKFFSFPKDESEQIKWFKAVGRDVNPKPADPRVCSLHFAEEDFARDLKYELLNPGKRHWRPRLKPGVYPTRHLNPSGKQECVVPGCHELVSGGGHLLPKAKGLRTAWLTACGLGDIGKLTRRRVCAHHFDMKRDYVTTDDGKLVLKPDAVPHLLLPPRKEPKTNRSGGQRCFVVGCQGDVSTFGYPLPVESVSRRSWLRACGHARPSRHQEPAWVCSRHFSQEHDFLPSEDGQVLLLKPDAVPHLHLKETADTAGSEKENLDGPDPDSPPAEDASEDEDSPAPRQTQTDDRARLVQDAIDDLERREAERRRLELLRESFRQKLFPLVEDRQKFFPLVEGSCWTGERELEEEVEGLTGYWRTARRLRQRVSSLETGLSGQRRALLAARLENLRLAAQLDQQASRRQPSSCRRLAHQERRVAPDTGSLLTPLLVLRPPAVGVEVSDPTRDYLPPSLDLTWLPTDLPAATQALYDLRLEVLALRTRLLRRVSFENDMKLRLLNEQAAHSRTELAYLQVLGQILTPSQVRALRKRQDSDGRIAGHRWQEEDYLRAVKLRSVCSKRAFHHVRHEMGIPMPSMAAVSAAVRTGRYPGLQEPFRQLQQLGKVLLTDTGRIRRDVSEDEQAAGPAGVSHQPGANRAGVGDQSGRAGVSDQPGAKRAGVRYLPGAKRARASWRPARKRARGGKGASRRAVEVSSSSGAESGEEMEGGTGTSKRCWFTDVMGTDWN